jgi:nitroreductase
VTAESQNDIHELIRGRWSSRNYDPDRPVPPEVIDRLLEAARWAPSSRNAQPWRYIVFDRRDGPALEKARACLNPGNRIWAGRAPLLLLAVAETVSAGGRINPKAFHDLGLANENLMLQAIAMGLHCRPMGGFDHECARRSFGVPPEFEPAVMIAVGYPGNAADLPDEIRARESMPRDRRRVEAIAFLGAWDTKYPGEY